MPRAREPSLSSYSARTCGNERRRAGPSTHATVGRDGHAVLDDDDVTGHDLAGLDVVLLAVADNDGAERDAGLELGDNVAGLLLLVPADEGVEHKNTDDDTKVDPLAQTGGEDDGNLHDCKTEV